jgi:hypothetical protein
MGWSKIGKGGIPIDRSPMIRAGEARQPVADYRSADDVGDRGRALVRTSLARRGATPRNDNRTLAGFAA